MRPRLLDAFCGAGGAAEGYSRAGFEIVGVDINQQPNYPFEFHQGDALDFVAEHSLEFNGVHASAPCQRWTTGQRLQGNDHPDLLTPMRELLLELDVLYVLENVPGAPLRDPVLLCGTMFPELRTYRHRLFETNFPVTAPLHGQHYIRSVKMGRRPSSDEWIQVVGNFSGAEAGREAMGIDWMTRDELSEAIPPAYTEHVGGYLMAAVQRLAAVP